MTAVFVDTNVLLYSEDGADADKQSRALVWLKELWTRRCGRLSTQVLSEFYVNATRRLKPAMPSGDARAEVRRYQRWHPWQVDQATIEAAWAVESRYKLGFWDALIVAAAQQQACEILLSEDLQHDQRFDAVRVINPFVLGPEALTS
ncbi:MAG: PIN domain-containing protein [Burkholderiaceae bacterium]|nr:PIN domain-containing protein [Burkholderiaceae bacterium]